MTIVPIDVSNKLLLLCFFFLRNLQNSLPTKKVMSHSASVDAHINFASGVVGDVEGACALPEARVPGADGPKGLVLPSAPENLLDEPEKESATLHSASIEAHINFASGVVGDVPGACALPKAELPKARVPGDLPPPPENLLDQ